MAFELNTCEDVLNWLSKTENHHETHLFVVKWKGTVPTIDKDRVKLLYSPDQSFLKVVLAEHKERRLGKRNVFKSEEYIDPDE